MFVSVSDTDTKLMITLNYIIFLNYYGYWHISVCVISNVLCQDMCFNSYTITMWNSNVSTIQVINWHVIWSTHCSVIDRVSPRQWQLYHICGECWIVIYDCFWICVFENQLNHFINLTHLHTGYPWNIPSLSHFFLINQNFLLSNSM
jgi:hypothetical protein